MHRFKYIAILICLVLLVPLVLVGCAGEAEMKPAQDVQFCVRGAWLPGSGGSTRALSATDILATDMKDIVIDYDDYPATVNVQCSDGNDFTLAKGTAICADHSDYWHYTPSRIYKDRDIVSQNLTFSATAVIDDDDELEGTASKVNIKGSHLQFTLHHTKALLRFSFKVSENYDKVCTVMVTGIQLNGSDCQLVRKVLTNTSLTYIAYAYIDPTVVTVSHENTIRCTYNIYDKDYDENAGDGDNAAHLTRKDVVAQNQFTLNKLKDPGGINNVTQIQAGYYYDLKVTLDPQYMYVLPEHGNKHITIE